MAHVILLALGPEEAEGEAAAISRQLAEALGAALETVRIPEAAVEVLAAHARRAEAALLVLGPSLGGAGPGLARHAPCPVLVVLAPGRALYGFAAFHTRPRRPAALPGV
ncbi:protein of unknown function [Candidatus Hydrogenisulfobacillus filiaventi]|uniref:Uncharacterized protein n=1 Tax=Candidatus Hydrogenisulfobacillus filiaventi TaxID=2707344 RepID=A0A6F8ZEY7_9FIRM|nr:hypothetical protein [Bacillota bacterium]CAB1128337.1 protein of unknown function [Candidatus Hydrogenisulfobacillus filiaventi]